jgi:hypothetical protein
LKKTLLTIGLLALIALTAKFIGGNAATDSAAQYVQQEANAQKMPTDIFGVKWLATLEELKQLRPNIQQESSELFSEQGLFLGRNAKIGYYVRNNSTLMFIITFSEPASMEDFNTTQISLSEKYGNMSAVATISDASEPTECSQRATERFRIDHCMRMFDTGFQEQITFYRTNES